MLGDVALVVLAVVTVLAYVRPRCCACHKRT